MNQPEHRHRVVADVSLDLTMDLDKPDLDALRRGFGTLSDRLVERLLTAGLDFDDVVIERFIVLRRTEQTLEVAAEYLSDAVLFERSIERQLQPYGVSMQDGALTISGIRVEAWTEQPLRRGP